MANLLDLPTNLPVSENDGKADHLVGMKLAHVELTHHARLKLSCCVRDLGNRSIAGA